MSGISLEKATLYEKYRLPYASQMVGDLLERIGYASVVADIGAGTGQLARLFAPRCARVYAIEPDLAMRQAATAALAAFNNIEILAGYAEQIPLPDNSIDMIVVGNAFHRFQPAACQELRRILKPGGWIALVSYTFANHAYTEMLFSRLATLGGLASRIEKAWPRLPIEALFGDSQVNTLIYPQSCTEDWPAFFGAACAGVEAPEPGEDEFAQFEANNREVFEAFAVNGKIQIDYETRVQYGQTQPG